MSMAGRSRIGSRLVSLVAAAATLLAAWLPPGRACACGTMGGPTRPVATASKAAPVCPCCGQRLVPGQAAKPCCVGRAGEPKGCGCEPVSPPDQPQPATPPPAGSDDGPVSIAGTITPTWVNASLTAGPTADEFAIQFGDPPPADLVISLSRLTC